MQGDTGPAQAAMVTERYAHILDDDRRVNATRFQKEFYGGSEPEAAAGEASEVRQASTDPLQNLDAAAKQQSWIVKLSATQGQKRPQRETSSSGICGDEN